MIDHQQQSRKLPNGVLLDILCCVSTKDSDELNYTERVLVKDTLQSIEIIYQKGIASSCHEFNYRAILPEHKVDDLSNFITLWSLMSSASLTTGQKKDIE